MRFPKESERREFGKFRACLIGNTIQEASVSMYWREREKETEREKESEGKRERERE